MNTPLQKAARNLILRWDSPLWKDQPHTGVYIAELSKALAGEQAQAVEPHGWMIDGSSEVMSRGHAQAVQTEHQAMGGTAVAYPIYTHPAPPATGERDALAAFAEWEDMGDPQRPATEAIAALRQAGVQ